MLAGVRQAGGDVRIGSEARRRQLHPEAQVAAQGQLPTPHRHAVLDSVRRRPTDAQPHGARRGRELASSEQPPTPGRGFQPADHRQGPLGDPQAPDQRGGWHLPDEVPAFAAAQQERVHEHCAAVRAHERRLQHQRARQIATTGLRLALGPQRPGAGQRPVGGSCPDLRALAAQPSQGPAAVDERRRDAVRQQAEVGGDGADLRQGGHTPSGHRRTLRSTRILRTSVHSQPAG